MSENWLQVIPATPGYVPTASQQEAVVGRLRALAPAARKVTAVCEAAVVFVDAGANFSRVHCPTCLSEVELAWWQEEMARAHEEGFSDLAVVTPCCQRATTLNDLVYDWPQGFARFRAEVASPGRTLLTTSELASLAAALGHDVREIWTHR